MKFVEKATLAQSASDEYEKRSAEELLAWAVNQFPRPVLACSFGAEDVVLVDMLQNIAPHVPIFYLDTDLHFRETYETRDRLEQHYGIRFIKVSPALTLKQQKEAYGDELWRKDPDQCCKIRKVDPLAQVLKQYDAWITGIRREQSPTRANAKKVEYDVKFGLMKCNPLADWTSEDVWRYIRTRQLIYNPLHDNNYPSIGCEKCTRQVKSGEDIRSGRWSGFAKTECGLHN